MARFLAMQAAVRPARHDGGIRWKHIHFAGGKSGGTPPPKGGTGFFVAAAPHMVLSSPCSKYTQLGFSTNVLKSAKTSKPHAPRLICLSPAHICTRYAVNRHEIHFVPRCDIQRYINLRRGRSHRSPFVAPVVLVVHLVWESRQGWNEKS